MVTRQFGPFIQAFPIPRLALPTFAFNSALTGLDFGIGGLASSISGISRATRKFTEPFRLLSELSNECTRLEAAGWLPHYTTPFDLVRSGLEGSDLSAALEEYYRENWLGVRAQFAERLSRYDISDCAKATFMEAIEAHGSGLYRVVAPTLFAEIERVVRYELLGGTLDGISSQHRLIELSGELTLHDIEPSGLRAWALWQRLDAHLYRHVRTSEQVAAVANDAVPNRHAALHGIVSYNTISSSINALIMADFVLQIVCALKRQGFSVVAA